MKDSLLLIHGPNLGLLGMRDPQRYGSTTLAEIEDNIKKHARQLEWDCLCYQSDVEGELVHFINTHFLEHAAKREKILGVIINPGAYAHTSLALRDALENIASHGISVIEVHLTNIFAREQIRRRVLTGEVAHGMISGFGEAGYVLALQAMVKKKL